MLAWPCVGAGWSGVGGGPGSFCGIWDGCVKKRARDGCLGKEGVGRGRGRSR